MGLRSSKLTSLNVENNAIGSAGLEALRVACLPTFDDRGQDARANPMVAWSNSVAGFYSRNSTLRELILSKNKLGKCAAKLGEIGRKHPALSRVGLDARFILTPS